MVFPACPCARGESHVSGVGVQVGSDVDRQIANGSERGSLGRVLHVNRQRRTGVVDGGGPEITVRHTARRRVLVLPRVAGGKAARRVAVYICQGGIC